MSSFIYKYIIKFFFILDIVSIFFSAPYVSDLMTLNDHPPKKAKIVVCGGGLVGTSLLYHLTKQGADAVLLEQGRFVYWLFIFCLSF